jgi:hypothetical protein
LLRSPPRVIATLVETAGLGCGPLIAIGAYTLGNGINNARTPGKGLLDGWDWKQAGLAAAGSLIAGSAGSVAGIGIGFGVGVGLDVTTQQFSHFGRVDVNHALCAGVAGGEAGGVVFGGKSWVKIAKDAAYGMMTSLQAQMPVCGGY